MKTKEQNISLSAEMENTRLEHNGCEGRCTCNTHFVLAVVAICVSCLTGFFATPLALAALIFSLRAQDQLSQNHLTEAQKSAFWSAVFGWITVGFLLVPLLVLIFFGGAILAAIGALAAAV